MLCYDMLCYAMLGGESHPLLCTLLLLAWAAAQGNESKDVCIVFVS
jgi:hypothetical protein